LFRIVGKAFGERWADTIDKDDITGYIERLKTKGRANSTINNLTCKSWSRRSSLRSCLRRKFPPLV
jgi:hypothetical protein